MNAQPAPLPDHLPVITPPVASDPRSHCGCVRLCAECRASDYGYTEAEDEIASEYIEAGEVAELVMELREAVPLLDWIARNVGDLPVKHLPAFRVLDRRARNLSKRVDELIEANA